MGDHKAMHTGSAVAVQLRRNVVPVMVNGSVILSDDPEKDVTDCQDVPTFGGVRRYENASATIMTTAMSATLRTIHLLRPPPGGAGTGSEAAPCGCTSGC